MFFKRKKSKIDPKIRFQNRQFNQKLHEARTYKRTVRAIPEGGFQRFLAAIGLGSTWKQIFALIIFGGLVYLVYIPNFLSTQKIIILGMSPTDTELTESAIKDSIKSAPFYNPQRNLLFLSKDRITQAVISMPAADRVNEIDKDFKTKTVTISITSKYERFLVRDAEKVYDVYNDGSIKGVAGVDRNYWESIQNPGMIKVRINGKITNPDNREFFTAETVQYILEAEKQMKGIIGSSLAYVQVTLPEFKKPAESPVAEQPGVGQPAVEPVSVDEVTEKPPESDPESDQAVPEPEPAMEVSLPLKGDELEFFMQKGNDPKRLFKVLVDTKESPHDVVQRLNLLLSQTDSARYNSLAYIDLRVKNRAFVCLLGTVCNN